jgi:hypothetical protein
MLACVVIPIYKPFKKLTYFEVISLKQGFKILSQHDIWLVGPENHDFEGYKELAETYEVKVEIKKFSPLYFKDLEGYNKLLKSYFFFEAFSTYNFMLIYQHDSFVFKDELLKWCRKGYDFVGAPWLDGWGDNTSTKIIGVGNGGFSLHNIHSALNVLSKAKNFHNSLEFIKKFMSTKTYSRFRRFIKFNVLKRIFGFKRSSALMMLNINENINEDYFWGELIPTVFKNFKVANVEDAIKFSFEVNPQHLYSLNQNKLPFGCHAWMKYDIEFWEPFILCSNREHDTYCE